MSENVETAILAGGCFWPAQQLLRHRDGVISTRVGYTGGENDNPTADNHPGHAETVEVIFDPERTSYRDILEFFFQIHRPDLGEGLVGSDYRSEIFYTSDEQRQVAEATIADADASGIWLGKVVTKISEAGPSGRPRPKTRTTSSTTPTARISSVRSRPGHLAMCSTSPASPALSSIDAHSKRVATGSKGPRCCRLPSFMICGICTRRQALDPGPRHELATHCFTPTSGLILPCS